jgi:putative oxidoreductase
MEDLALLVLRLVLGGVFIAHGAQKLFGWFGRPGLKGTAGFFDQLGIKPGSTMALLAGLAEFGGGLLVLVGLLTPVAALAIIAVMIAAILKAHLANGFFNTSGGYEFNLMLIAGAGAYSLDGALGILW